MEGLQTPQKGGAGGKPEPSPEPKALQRVGEPCPSLSPMSAAGDVAAFIAAGASLCTLGTSIYIARYQSKHSQNLERIRWRRERLVDQVIALVAAIERLLRSSEDEDALELVTSILDMDVPLSLQLSDSVANSLEVLLREFWRYLFPEEFPARKSIEYQRNLATVALADFKTKARSELGIDIT